ncbi:hypothetical protein [Paraburkholderia caribensis]|uniref:hypothetical protein n=1 Tax=Paraburkholderia caribensis TaxID=75105 RepID=UPI0034D1C998
MDYSGERVPDGEADSVVIDAAYCPVALVGLGVPGIGGIDVLRSARAAVSDVPVLPAACKAHIDKCIRALMRFGMR